MIKSDEAWLIRIRVEVDRNGYDYPGIITTEPIEKIV